MMILDLADPKFVQSLQDWLALCDAHKKICEEFGYASDQMRANLESRKQIEHKWYFAWEGEITNYEFISQGRAIRFSFRGENLYVAWQRLTETTEIACL